MKKFPLMFILMLVAALPAMAQGGYRFDNIDVGVHIETVPTTATLTPTKKARSTAKNAHTRPASTAYIRTSVAEMTASKSLDGFTTGDPKIDSFIVESGARNGVDPVLIYSIMHQESSFKRGAISPKGARGLMQLMPGTAARFGVTNIFDPRQNIEGGTRYMRFLLDTFDGDVSLALAGYNAGEGAVLKYGRRIPPYRETQEYVRKISQRYAMLRDPSTARFAPRVSRTQIAKLKAAEPPPLVHETSISVVRTPDATP